MKAETLWKPLCGKRSIRYCNAISAIVRNTFPVPLSFLLSFSFWPLATEASHRRFDNDKRRNRPSRLCSVMTVRGN